MTTRIMLLLILVLLPLACKQNRQKSSCPSQPQSLARVLAEDALDGCEVTTIGYFAPDEFPILYLSKEDYTQGNLSGGLFLQLSQQRDDRGEKVALRTGKELTAANGAQVLQVTGTVVWADGVPRLSNPHDLTTWPTRPKAAAAAGSSPQ